MAPLRRLSARPRVVVDNRGRTIAETVEVIQGPPGPQGPQGPAGPPGPAGGAGALPTLPWNLGGGWVMSVDSSGRLDFILPNGTTQFSFWPNGNFTAPGTVGGTNV